MGRYVDGYVLPVPKKCVDAYRPLTVTICRFWASPNDY
jgi:uncharacterized protein YbaA (DUF1428 family)